MYVVPINIWIPGLKKLYQTCKHTDTETVRIPISDVLGEMFAGPVTSWIPDFFFGGDTYAVPVNI